MRKSAVNAFLVPPQLYTVGIDINVKIADMAYIDSDFGFYQAMFRDAK